MGVCEQQVIQVLVDVWSKWGWGYSFWRFATMAGWRSSCRNVSDIVCSSFDHFCSLTYSHWSSVPTPAMPAGASHKLHVWIRSLVPLTATDPSTSYVLPFNDSYIYQRLWKCDSFKIGGRLDFESLGSKMLMGFSSGMPETIVMPNPPPLELYTSSSSQSVNKDKRDEFWSFQSWGYCITTTNNILRRRPFYDLHRICMNMGSWECQLVTAHCMVYLFT
jgi:hypothetical protein